MGLHVSFYRQLVLVKDVPMDIGGNCMRDDVISFYRNPWMKWANRFDGLVDGAFYTYGDAGVFSPGTYLDYSDFRNRLAKMAGYTAKPEDNHGEPFSAGAWDEPNDCGKPFHALIDFADNEGSLGTAACKQLLEDFEFYAETAAATAKALRNPKFGSIYEAFHMAMRAAADGGAIKFH